jgi:hypothetical protein
LVLPIAIGAERELLKDFTAMELFFVLIDKY